jgi:thiamine biosynthesis lipoprotein
MMGMPITVSIVDENATKVDLEDVFSYFKYVDEKFSTYKKTSEITAINEGKLNWDNYSEDMKEVFKLSEETELETNGYFNIKKQDGTYDTSGLVKGWAIYNASKIIKNGGFKNYYVEAGGDIQVEGKNENGTDWAIGIKDPFDKTQQNIVKVVYLTNEGIATSGTYIRGDHIYNPHDKGNKPITDIISLTVIGKNVYEADRFATGAFAMGKGAIHFIEKLPGFEGYMIDKDHIGTMTSGFEKYTKIAK